MNENETQAPLFHRFVRGAFDYLELFALSVFAVLVVFTFGFRLCQVEGRSMENTLHDKEYLLVRSFAYQPKQDDIIVFHGLNKTLVKRVVAVGGQEVIIDINTNQITVDGEIYADSHAVLKNRRTDEITNTYQTDLFYNDFDSSSGIYRITVPEGKLFVLGDNRNNSTDSRNPDVGFVDEHLVLGKVFLRVVPFRIFS